MKPVKDRHLAARPLPQLVVYVDSQLPSITDTMRRTEAIHVDEPGHVSTTWQIYGKRPKVRDANQFVTMLERLLIEKLEEAGYKELHVNGLSADMSFLIMWRPERVADES